MNYELAIIGSGPAGFSAAIYAVRAGIKTVVIDKGIGGGLANVSPKIENYPGFESISGMDLMEKMKNHASKYADFHFNLEVNKIDKIKELNYRCIYLYKSVRFGTHCTFWYTLYVSVHLLEIIIAVLAIRFTVYNIYYVNQIS